MLWINAWPLGDLALLLDANSICYYKTVRLICNRFMSPFLCVFVVFLSSLSRCVSFLFFLYFVSSFVAASRTLHTACVFLDENIAQKKFEWWTKVKWRLDKERHRENEPYKECFVSTNKTAHHANQHIMLVERPYRVCNDLVTYTPYTLKP